MIYFHRMNCGEQRNDRLACSDISLQESRHGIWLFHILEDLEEDDLLLVREREWKICDERFHEIYIEWNLWSKSFTLRLGIFFFLHADILEPEELLISEFSFGSFKCFYRGRKVNHADIRSMRLESFLLTDCSGKLIRYFLEKWLYIDHLISNPGSRNIVHIRIYGHDLLTFGCEMFDLTRGK